MDIPSWAVVGAEVVCVNDSPNVAPMNHTLTYKAWDGVIVKGEIYKIRKIEVDEFTGATTFLLFGIYRSDPSRKGEPGFWIERFRPLIRKTLEEDMEMFVPLLKTVKIEELV